MRGSVLAVGGGDVGEVGEVGLQAAHASGGGVSGIVVVVWMEREEGENEEAEGGILDVFFVVCLGVAGAVGGTVGVWGGGFGVSVLGSTGSAEEL